MDGSSNEYNYLKKRTIECPGPKNIIFKGLGSNPIYPSLGVNPTELLGVDV